MGNLEVKAFGQQAQRLFCDPVTSQAPPIARGVVASSKDAVGRCCYVYSKETYGA